MKLKRFMLYTMLFIVLVVAFSLGIYKIVEYNTERIYIEELVVDSREDIANNCRGLDLFETGECLNKNIKKIYKYNISQVSKDLTFQQIKDEGGVCDHYATLYKVAAEELGFDAKRVIIGLGTLNYSHAFAVFSNEEGYCIGEQSKVMCVRIKN